MDTNQASGAFPSSTQRPWSGLRRGLTMVALGFVVFLAGYLSLGSPALAALLFLGFVGFSFWLDSRPAPSLSWRSSMAAAAIAWIPLMGVYWWRSRQAALMGADWGTALVLAPGNEMLVVRLTTWLVISCALSGLSLGVIGALLSPWSSHAWARKSRLVIWNSATVCLALCFVLVLAWMGRSFAIMGLAG